MSMRPSFIHSVQRACDTDGDITQDAQSTQMEAA